MVKRGVLLFVLMAFLIPFRAYSADGSNLPGSGIKTEEALSKAAAVFAGKIIDLGTQYKWPPDGHIDTSYYHVKVALLHTFQGFVNNQTVVEFVVSKPKNETAPEFGGSYIFFITEDGAGASVDRYFVLKFLPATNENVAVVERLCAKK